MGGRGGRRREIEMKGGVGRRGKRGVEGRERKERKRGGIKFGSRLGGGLLLRLL